MGWVGFGRDFSIFGWSGWVVGPKRQKPKNKKNTFTEFVDTDGHGLGWFVGWILGPGSKFSLWYGLAWIGWVSWWVWFFSLCLRNTACSNKVSDILQRLAVNRVKHSVNFF